MSEIRRKIFHDFRLLLRGHIDHANGITKIKINVRTWQIMHASSSDSKGLWAPHLTMTGVHPQHSSCEVAGGQVPEDNRVCVRSLCSEEILLPLTALHYRLSLSSSPAPLFWQSMLWCFVSDYANILKRGEWYGDALLIYIISTCQQMGPIVSNEKCKTIWFLFRDQIKNLQAHFYILVHRLHQLLNGFSNDVLFKFNLVDCLEICS